MPSSSSIKKQHFPAENIISGSPTKLTGALDQQDKYSVTIKNPG
jgi:hypothetical protein